MAPSDPSHAPDPGNLAEDQAAAALDSEEEDRALLAQLTVGSIVDNKYRVESVLGRGAMGVVLLAMHQHLGEKVALKFLRYRAKAGAAGGDFQTRFRREARVSAKLKNEHITRVIDVGLWKERVPYMVMDYLEGSDLRDLIKGQGPLPIGVAIDYTVQVCIGIAEAHANGIVHRDVKPSNLFLTKRPDGSDLVKVLDFGISKWRAGEVELDELTQTGVVLGSPKYMSPEQLFGSSDVDARADVWSIGAILYEMIAGRPPFDLPTFTRICAELSTDRPPPSLIEKRPEVTPELEAVIMKCFVRDPDKRTHDVAELAGNLLDAVQAPFAAAMRQKIASMLDPGGAGLGTGSGGTSSIPSGGYSPIASGAFAATMSTTGSGPRSPGGNVPTTTASNPQLLSGSPGALQAPEQRNAALLPGLVIGAVLVLGIAGYVTMSGKPAPAPASMAAPPAVTIALPPPAPPESASAMPSASTAPSATAPTSQNPTAGSGPVLPAREPLGTPPQRSGSRPGWHARPAPPPPPTPAATVAQTPAAAPAPPAPAPPPAATPPKTDPLGDRQ